MDDKVFYDAVDVVYFSGHLALGMDRVDDVDLLRHLDLEVEINQSWRRNKVLKGVQK